VLWRWSEYHSDNSCQRSRCVRFFHICIDQFLYRLCNSPFCTVVLYIGVWAAYLEFTEGPHLETEYSIALRLYACILQMHEESAELSCDSYYHCRYIMSKVHLTVFLLLMNSESGRASSRRNPTPAILRVRQTNRDNAVNY